MNDVGPHGLRRVDGRGPTRPPVEVTSTAPRQTVRVIGETPADDVTAEVDRHDLPLTVTWTPWPVEWLTLRVSGEHGGELELRLDASTGSLVTAIVLIEPPGTIEDLRQAERVRTAPSCTRPVVSRSWWLDEDGAMPWRPEPVFITVPHLAWRHEHDRIEVQLADRPVATRLRAKNVTVGVSANDDLVAFEIDLTNHHEGA